MKRWISCLASWAGESVADVVLVTGAAGGIGQSLVRAFAESGYAVIGVDRAVRPDSLPCEHFIECDLAQTAKDAGYAAGVFGDVRAALAGRSLAALINNAAAQVVAPVPTLTRQDWDQTLAVNLLAPFFWAQAFLPELEAAHGMVLNVSSIHARLTKQGFVAYATSKAALSGMTRAMAVELGARVRVNAIEPAAIDTPMLRAGFSGDEAGYSRLKSFHPTETIGNPDELARFVRTLVEFSGGFANGSVIAFDGGIGGRLHDPG